MPTNNTPAANSRSRFVIFILQVTEQHQGKTRHHKAGADPKTALFQRRAEQPRCGQDDPDPPTVLAYTVKIDFHLGSVANSKESVNSLPLHCLAPGL